MNAILFLDLDGVMHSEPSMSHEAFTQLPLIESVLRDFPAVDIVISSACRLDWSREPDALAFLRQRFSPDVASRVVGVTPDFSWQERCGSNGGTPLREYECEAWLKRNRPAGTSWLALDDRAEYFSPECPHLMTADGNDEFMDFEAETFRQRLVEITPE